MAQKKILICITKSNWGGAQKYVFDIAKNIKDRFNTTVLLGGNGELKEKLGKIGVKTITLKNSERNTNIFKDIKLLFELFKVFKTEKPDIIHLNSSKIGFIGTIVGRILGIKNIIFTVHGWAFNENRPWWQRFVFWTMQTKTVFFSHHTIAVSENIKRQLKPKWLQKKIVVIYNGIDDLVFLDKDSAKKELINKIAKNLDSKITGNKVIGTISELHKNKGLEYVIRAFKKLDQQILNQTNMLIIGEGEERNNLEKIIANLNLQDKVFLLGAVPDAYKYLKAFDIFTLTSITEAFPYSILEAGKAELLVIASNVGGIPEIIEDNKSGILTKVGDIEKISETVKVLTENAALKNTYGKALKNKVDLKFSISKMIRETVDIYNK
jgi:glycosyltransferase involved in cell wall biosynthesis